MRKTRSKLIGILFACLIAGSFNAFAGWQHNPNGTWSFLNDQGQPIANNWLNDSGAIYFIDQNGIMKTGWVNVGQKWYFMGKDGAMKTGWIRDGNDWYYIHPSGIMAADEAITSNGKIYYLDGSGRMAHDTEINGVTYGTDGAAILEVTDNSGNNAYYDAYSAAADELHDEFVQQVLEYTNKYRKKNGRSALKLSKDLCEYADIRAAELVEYYSHTRPDGSECFTVYDEDKYKYGYKGENIAAGQLTPEEVTTDWYNSPGHRKNILNKHHKELGVGICYANGMFHWVQLFAGKI